MINTPEISQEIDIQSHYLFPDKHSAVKSVSNLFGVSKWDIRRKTGKEKHNRYMIRTKLDEISWIKIDKKWREGNKKRDNWKVIKFYL